MVLVCGHSRHGAHYLALGVEGVFVCTRDNYNLLYVYCDATFEKNQIKLNPVDFWKPLRGNDLGEVGDRIKRYFKESTIAFAITAVVLIAMIVAYYTWQSECFGAIHIRR